jgi:hypothetical protein
VIFDHGQLNHDAAQTLHFLGLAHSSQMKMSEAIFYLEKALTIRRLSVNGRVWDELTKGILESLVEVGGIEGDRRVEDWTRDFFDTYLVVMEDDFRTYLT